MKYFFLVLIFLTSLVSFFDSSYAACIEVRSTSTVSDPYDPTSNCFTDTKTNKTYSVVSSSPKTTQGPDTGNSDNLLGFDWDKIRS
jgi:hypothetical protein